ncbi:hydroxylase [Nocardioides sp. cx-173]|uniref:hydroxylase n=1 Tax=Nocardioides sp. cx-173 TaxID=2898796 RepID=UPI001E49FA0B|nr:hydroxylase [Nocardioides sp. cx-173]MCD4526617.1 hydroxylase [Nocardioides sp. cx-173]UGB40710.1 hydroxylase [Nocardioides sp. cx-173]
MTAVQDDTQRSTRAPLEVIREHAETLRDDALTGDQQGLITQRTADILADSGGMKLLLAQDLGGYEAHPNDFFDWVIAVGENQPSAGWITGVVGVHPWQISIMNDQTQQEIYGEGPDPWVASPYAPFGRARRVDGGYLLSGRWPFSTGTDYCDWIILGGMVADDQGEALTPPDVRHFVLPRRDYEVVPDSWKVLGLRGTGSKDIRMADVFVPDHRVYSAVDMYGGKYARENRPGQTLYQMMFGLMFPAAISAGTFGILRGAVRAYAEHIAGRVTVSGVTSRTDPFQLSALARAESDVEASIAHFRSLVAEVYDHVSRGHEVTDEQRLRFRRDQVRATTRSIAALDELFRSSGASSIQEGHPVERFRRDLHVAATHMCNVPEVAYQNHGNWRFTGELPKGAY